MAVKNIKKIRKKYIASRILYTDTDGVVKACPRTSIIYDMSFNTKIIINRHIWRKLRKQMHHDYLIAQRNFKRMTRQKKSIDKIFTTYRAKLNLIKTNKRRLNSTYGYSSIKGKYNTYIGGISNVSGRSK